MREETAARWFEQAKWDLKSAEDSKAAGNYEWACFQSQQAVEKALKAVILAAGAAHPTTHSVRILLAECERLVPNFAELRPAAELDQFYAPTRYPDALPGDVPHDYYTEEAAERCLSLASSVIAFVTRSSES